MKRQIALAAGILLYALAFGASAGFKEGMAAIERKDYETAFRELRPVAEKGDPIAQQTVGNMYYDGRGIAKDYGEAAKWYERAAGQGSSPAQTNLGIMYWRGIGVKKDYGRAVRLLRQAAEQGEEMAALHLGDIYHRGDGVRRDDTEALKWYLQAAAKDEPEAQRLVGNSYWIGQGTEQDVAQAWKWLESAANQGYAPSQADLSLIYFRGDGGTPVDYRLACLWSSLALQGLKGDSYRQGAMFVQDVACRKLSPDDLRRTQERIAAWKPDKVWFNRQVRETQERHRQWQRRPD